MTVRAWLARHLAAACVLGFASIASAQITTGAITGTVRDGQGGVIPGATVVLTSDTQGTKSSPVVTDANGDFVFVNLRADTYTIEVSMPSFSTLKRAGLQVSPGERLSVGSLVIEVGRTTEVVDVKAEAPIVQSSSAERSFTISTDSVTNLPIAGRAFTQLAALAPGVTGTSRIGDRPSTGGGDTNIQMDGVSTMDTGSNRAIIDLNVESIAEVKVLVSSYQAEFGRSSGLQITAVTKSGTNRFRGSVYDVERNSDWYANSKTNILNGDPKAVLRQRDWGYSIGGPVGKPGGSNKLFFFYTQEFEPRTGGNDVSPLSPADGAGASGRFLENRPTTSATSIRTSRTRQSPERARPPTRPRASRMATCSDAFPPRSCTRPGSISSRCTRCRTSTTFRPGRPTTSRSPGRQRAS